MEEKDTSFEANITEEELGVIQLTPQQQVIKSHLLKAIKNVRGVPSLVPEVTAANFLIVFREDERFADVRLNLISNRPMHVTEDGEREWTAVDDAASRTYIEKIYELSNQRKWEDAFIEFQHEREYNPIHALIENTEWDGIPRIETFLIDWMKADDTPYNREVSRLLFAGAINRSYNPGCKFDCVPVLIGNQGGGKSTFCHWLALEDRFYTSINTIQGQKGAEQIQGVWICEIEELLAILANHSGAGNAKEEAAKAFISKQDEYWREAYTKRAVHHPRQCIFIGTTNRETFLTDQTGSRRWFPVRTHSVASDLYEHEAECKAAILQAWAEAKYAFDHDLPLVNLAPKAILMNEIKEQQKDAEDVDYRIGLIEDYLKDKDRVCIVQVFKEAICRFENSSSKLTRHESNEIMEILTNKFGWVRGGVENFGEVYMKQKALHRPKASSEVA